MAQLLDQAVYAPSNARFKVYMIDEVHMLTNHAFNAMLKTLEEPPEHVKFILATTDPQKIPVTVLSRCLQFNLKQMPPGQIVAHLDDILGQEGITFETPALRLLAQGAHGSMRDALSLTDQAIAYAAGTVSLEAVQGMLGALDQSYLIRLLDALAIKDAAALLAIADEMATRSLSYGGALRDLGSLLHQIALAQTAPTALADDLPERAELLRLAAIFDAEEVQLFYQIVVHGRNELGLAPDEYAGFSMTLLRMLAFLPLAENSVPPPAPLPKVVATVARLQAAPQTISTSAPVARAGNPARAALDAARSLTRPNGGVGGSASNASSTSSTSTASNASIASTPMPRAAAVPSRVPPIILPESDQMMPPLGEFDDAPFESHHHSVEKKSAPSRTSESLQPSIVAAAVDTAPPVLTAIPALNWDGDWPTLAVLLPLRGVVQQLALQAEFIECDTADGIELRLRAPIETLASPANIEKLTNALSSHFAQPLRVTVAIGNVRHTANAKAESQRAERQRQAELQIRNDPFVLSMLREFGATIVPGSIKPV